MSLFRNFLEIAQDRIGLGVRNVSVQNPSSLSVFKANENWMNYHILDTVLPSTADFMESVPEVFSTNKNMLYQYCLLAMKALGAHGSLY